MLLSAGVVANILFMQGGANGKVGIQHQATRLNQRSAVDRARNLTLDPLPEKRNATAPTVGRTAKTEAGRSGDGEFLEVSAAIQRELQSRGYQPGSQDGVAGAVTRAAIMAWEHDHGLALTGEPTDAIMKAIVLGVSAASAGQITAQWQALPKERRTRAEHLIRWVQQSLSALGYNPGPASGRVSTDTARAIREFEMDQNLAPSGRISGPLVARASKLTMAGRSAPIN